MLGEGDKARHFIIGYIIGATLSGFPLVGLSLAVLAGISKEVYDCIAVKYLGIPHSIELRDVLATAFGGLVGVGIPFLIKLGIGYF